MLFASPASGFNVLADYKDFSLYIVSVPRSSLRLEITDCFTHL